MKVSLPDFSKANVLVIGDIMLDRYWYGTANKISPEAPIPIVKIDKIKNKPGGAANVAMNIASLGAYVHLIGLTGTDDYAKILISHLKKINIICDFTAVDFHSTITKLRIISRNQQLIRIDFDKGFNDVDTIFILKRLKIIISNFDILVLSDYAKGTLTYVREMISLARFANIPVLIDPKGNDFTRYAGATLLTPNLVEFESVVGCCKDEKMIITRGMNIINEYKISALLITRSEQGMTLLQFNKEPLILTTQTQEVFDVTGAGDTVISVLAVSLVVGKSLEESCFLANIAAGIVVKKFGTSVIKLIDLKKNINVCHEEKFGILSENELKKAVFLARQQGEIIVMTNGIFDILHAGHISYLSNAKKLGNRLIVAVNSDDSTKRLKGESRPIISLEQRMIVLSALKVVDWVISFNEDTPQRIISDILPDFLVKGGDYQINEIVGGKEVLDNGGCIKILNFEVDCSSTKIINLIKKNKDNNFTYK